MDGILVIAVLGLAFALLAASVTIRRLDRALDATRTALTRQPQPDPPDNPLQGSDPLDELLPIGIVHLDGDGRIGQANTRAHVLLDAAPGRLIGRSVIEAFLDATTEALIEGVPPGGSATGEVRIGDGDARTILVRIHRTEEPGAYLVLEDVTELRRLQQIRAEFIDNLSHELRTPLTTVSLLAETLARDAESADVPGRMRDRITKVEVETGHLVQMINELLDLARIEGGTPLHLVDDVDLGRLAVLSTDRLHLFADRQGVRLAVDARPTPTVRGDEDRLAQVFINLVHNAVKFSPDGGDVVVMVRGDHGEVVASVIDHGIGISKADCARIFERFYKVDRARVRGGGTGLGLAIARHVVGRHGGRIWVDSEEGRGSTFSFAIPIASEPWVSPAVNAPAAAVAADRDGSAEGAAAGAAAAVAPDQP